MVGQAAGRESGKTGQAPGSTATKGADGGEAGTREANGGGQAAYPSSPTACLSAAALFAAAVGGTNLR